MAMNKLRAVTGRLSLTAKLIVTIVIVNLVGLVASVAMLDRTAGSSLLGLATEQWEIQTGQVAAAAAGGLRWKKPEVVADAYSAYLAEDRNLLSRVIAFDAAGNIVVEHTDEGAQTAAIDAIMHEEVAKAPSEIVRVPA